MSPEPNAPSAPAAADLKRNFILQQGLGEPPAQSCPMQFSALLFQPRIVGAIVLVASLLREPIVFLALGALLWWNALLPQWNPFDAIHNSTAARQPGGIALDPAPAPRRFAQGMAGTFALAIGTCYLLGWRTTALVINLMMLAALAALLFGGLCLGSVIFYYLTGRADFAKSTLPWARAV